QVQVQVQVELQLEVQLQLGAGMGTGVPVWRMMNFRQRMGWVGVALYLLLSVMAVYYVFEVHTRSLERVQRGGVGPSARSPAVTWSVLPSLPVWMWASVFLLPYLQLFLFLFSCTRADPRAVGYCVLPVCIALVCSRRHAAQTPANHRAGSVINT
uniref:Lysosomal enzyme trafficking factor n=2 Tax=Seriola lalandi dorsalis TaxID=1841481 RepID=A0A3B4WAT2_SERLL